MVGRVAILRLSPTVTATDQPGVKPVPHLDQGERASRITFANDVGSANASIVDGVGDASTRVFRERVSDFQPECRRVRMTSMGAAPRSGLGDGRDRNLEPGNSGRQLRTLARRWM